MLPERTKSKVCIFSCKDEYVAELQKVLFDDFRNLTLQDALLPKSSASYRTCTKCFFLLVVLDLEVVPLLYRRCANTYVSMSLRPEGE